MLEEKQTLCVVDFGPFRLDESARVLLRRNDIVPLAVKAFEILAYLVRHHGKVISKEALMKHVWPDCFVEENNLSQNVSALRRALSDDPEKPKYIETIPRRGYRFIGEIREQPSVNAATPETPAPPATTNATRASRVKSLAVLPFQCFGGGSAAEFLDIGLADALITKLSNVEQIEVRPTGSILRYKGAAPDWVKAGSELNVDALLHGCVQLSGDKVRVTVQLVAAADGITLWAGQFDEPFTDIFTVEDSISQQVVRTLVIRLSKEERQRLTQRSTSNPEAHQAYLRGRHFWNRRTESDLQKSVRCFQEAVAHDPGYALAYAGMADSFTVLGGYGILSPDESYKRARAAATQALEIDDRLAEAHTSLGDVAMYYDWRAADAERHYLRAIDLRPDYATAHHFYAWYLVAKGEFSAAAAEMRRAQEIDPLSPMINTTLGLPAYFSGDFDQAIRQISKALELDPNFPQAQIYLGRAYLHSGQRAPGLEAIERAVEPGENRPLILSAFAHALAVNGKTAEAVQLLNQLIALRQTRYVSAYHIATVFSGLGDLEQAMHWLNQAFADRVNQMVILEPDPVWKALRADQRFRELIKRVAFFG